MELRCMLCDQPTGAIGAMLIVGDAQHPDAEVICHSCAALAPEQLKPLRDQAMTRRLQNGEG